MDKLKIYPNPATDKVSLEFTVKKSTMVKLILYNELGKKVKSQNKKVITGLNQISINTQNIKSGIYFVSLEIDGEIVTKQIVKQ